MKKTGFSLVAMAGIFLLNSISYASPARRLKEKTISGRDCSSLDASYDRDGRTQGAKNNLEMALSTFLRSIGDSTDATVVYAESCTDYETQLIENSYLQCVRCDAKVTYRVD